MKKHAFLKRALVLLITAVLILSVTGCTKDYSDWLSSVADQFDIETMTPVKPTQKPDGPTQKPDGPTQKPDGPTEKPDNPTVEPPVSSNLIPEYREITEEEFYALCDEMIAAAAGTDFSKVKALYDKLYQEFAQVSDNYTLSYLGYCREVSNEELQKKYQELEELAYDLSDRAMQAFRAVTQGPCAEEFFSYVGEVSFDYFAEYEDMTDQEKEWKKRETELVTEYNSMMDEYGDLIWSQDAFVNEKVGPIFMELLKLRTDMARYYGYDNYADYADENVFYRDYDKAAAEKFHKAVKQISGRYYDLLYYSNAYFGIENVYTSMKPDEIIGKLQSIGSRISPLAEEYSRLLKDYKLYDISDASGRLDAAYTTSFETTRSAYIFVTSDGGPRDFMTMTHEFGHFINMNLVPNPNLFVYGSSMDLNEIHSNGFEALCTKYYKEVYGENEPAAVSRCLIELLMNVVDGCIYDEFQRRVYENPDMTLEEINDCFESTVFEYGDFYMNKYIWQYVNHNFESPMYYLSYAASGIVALQIWAKSQTDYDGAVKMWEDIQKAGPYDYGYFELLDNLDILTFDDSNNVVQVCDIVLDYLEKNNPTR